MYSIISQYMNNLTKEKITQFAISKNITLSNEELDFTYKFVKKNWEKVLANPNILKIDRYEKYYSKENYQKIKKLITEYQARFQNYF